MDAAAKGTTMPAWATTIGEWLTAHPRALAAVDLLHKFCWAGCFAACALLGWRLGRAIKER